MASLIRKMIFMTTLTLTTILVFGVNITRIEARDFRIAVFMSYKGAPFDETVEGFKRYLSKQGLSIDYDLYPLEGDSAKAAQTIQKIKSNKPNLIFSLGSLATDPALKEFADVPIIAGLLLRADNVKKTTNSIGIYLEYPPETQFKWLQRILPDTRSIGAIYNPKENQERMESASKVASRMGLKLETQKVDVPQDLPEALNRLAKNADVFWGVADSLVLNPQTAKYMLLFSFQNRIPFIGLSSTWVKAGALYSLDWDYTDIGMQCGEIAFKVFQGVPIHSMLLAAPRKVIYTLNLNTANQMKIKISEEIIRGAHQIF